MHSRCSRNCAGPAGGSCEFGGTHDPTMIMGDGGKRDQALIAVDAVFFF
jgi:hypothetical protein